MHQEIEHKNVINKTIGLSEVSGYYFLSIHIYRDLIYTSDYNLTWYTVILHSYMYSYIGILTQWEAITPIGIQGTQRLMGWPTVLLYSSMFGLVI